MTNFFLFTVMGIELRAFALSYISSPRLGSNLKSCLSLSVLGLQAFTITHSFVIEFFKKLEYLKLQFDFFSNTLVYPFICMLDFRSIFMFHNHIKCYLKTQGPFYPFIHWKSSISTSKELSPVEYLKCLLHSSFNISSYLTEFT